MTTILPSPSKATANVACPECGSTGPFKVSVSRYACAKGEAQRVEIDGCAEWTQKPADWHMGDLVDETEFGCYECDNYFDLDLAVY